MIKAINAKFSFYPGVEIFENLNFHFKEGDRVGISGANGAGKTTFLRLLSRIYEPQSGIVEINGGVNTILDIGSGMNSEATGLENIYMRGVLFGVSRAYLKLKEAEIIELSGLGEAIKKPLRTYSSGMLMRLAFSISMVIPSNILIMDEWLSVGDASFNKKAENILNEYIEKSSILVLASHSESLLKNVCNRFFKIVDSNLLEVSRKDFVL